MTASSSLMHGADPCDKQDFTHVPVTRALPSSRVGHLKVTGKAAVVVRGSSASRSVQGEAIPNINTDWEISGLISALRRRTWGAGG